MRSKYRLIFFFTILMIMLSHSIMAQSPPTEPLPVPEDFRGFETAPPILDARQSAPTRLPLNTQPATTVNTTTTRLSYDCSSQSDIPSSECQALVALYNSTNGDGWLDNTGWGASTPCNWYGVYCTSTNVYYLGLSGNQLSGTIPSDIGNFSQMTGLSLYNNALTGTIPSTIGNLSLITHLDLENNLLSGTIPSVIGNLSQLETLYLDSNLLSGSIPTTFGNLSQLDYLNLADNQLTGTIPAEIGNLTLLRALFLGGNQLTGSIPTTIGNLSLLEFFNVRENELTGTIPVEIGNLTNLTDFVVSKNQLTGGIPASIVNLSQLEWIDLLENQLTGPIPAGLANLTNLQFIEFSGNQLTGPIPANIGNLTNLWFMSMYNNDIGGDLPASIANLINLELLELGGNDLTGTIPANIGNLTKLTGLGLAGNRLTGTIPASISNMTLLDGLSLSSNQLTGEIPAGITTLTNLEYITLNSNQLTGPIPADIGNLTKLYLLYLYDNELTGPIPAGFSNLTNLEFVALERNKLSGAIPDGINNFANLEWFTFYGNQITSLPASMALLPEDVVVYMDFNMLDLTGNLAAWADIVNPYWRYTQTIMPKNITVDTSTVDSNGIVKINWDTIGYIGNDGYFEVFCSTQPGASPDNYDVRVLTADKFVSSITLSGLPIANYNCTVRTVTLDHLYNKSTLTSPISGQVSFTVNQNFPPINDNFANRTPIERYPFLYFTTNLANASLEAGAPLPSCVNLASNARSIYFSLVDGGPLEPNPYGEQGSWVRGSRDIISFRNTTRTTIAVYRGNRLDRLNEIECVTFDNVNSAQLDLLTQDFEDYTIIVWADEPAGGALRATSADSYTQIVTQSTFDSIKKCDAVTSISKSECEVLVDLFNDLGGSNWRSSQALVPETWLRFNDPCHWSGVTCTNGGVTGLDFSGQGLVGFIPSYLEELIGLESIDLSNNVLSGEIPAIFNEDTFKDLEAVNLSGNNLRSSNTDVIDFIEQFDPDWQDTQTPLANASFEGGKTKGIPVTWSGSNTTIPGKDKQKCDKPEKDKYIAYEGECALMFKGNGNGTKSKIKQLVASTYDFTNGSNVTFSMFVDNRSAPADRVFAKFLIVYSDGNQEKIRLRLPEPSGYTQVGDTVTVDLFGGRTVDKVKIIFIWKLTSGKFFVDGAFIDIEQGITTLAVDPVEQRVPTTTENITVPVPEGFRK